MSVVGRLHRLVFARRIRRLAAVLADLLPDHGTVLDVGSGDGHLAARIMELRPGLRITGVDVLVRQITAIPVTAYDGRTLPFAAGVFDSVLLVDVLHHAENGLEVLREAARVARCGVVVKDHYREGWLAQPTLGFMDWVGNARHGVALPGNYWTRGEWEAAQRDAALRIDKLETHLGLYPWPASLVFERSLHFAARLCPS
jgi:SAM-dependent methyltransferase